MKLFALLLSLSLFTTTIHGLSCPQEGRWPATEEGDEAAVLCDPLYSPSTVQAMQSVISFIIPHNTKDTILSLFQNSILQTRNCNASGIWEDAQGNCPTPAGCWAKEHTTNRHLMCNEGNELDGALCYPKCKQDYNGVGPVCWSKCPSGTTDLGVACKYPGYVVTTADTKHCPWYDMCGLATGCSKCPAESTNLGCLCSHDKITAKDSYGRGVGTVPSFSPCAEGKGIGPFCTKLECPSGTTECGILCTNEKDKCKEIVTSIVGDAINLLLSADDVVGWLLGSNDFRLQELRLLLELALTPRC